MKQPPIKLDCGVEAKRSTYKGTESLEISLMDLFQGYGELSNFAKLSELFLELSAKGFENRGLSRIEGYYNSTDDLLLDVSRKIT